MPEVGIAADRAGGESHPAGDDGAFPAKDFSSGSSSIARGNSARDSPFRFAAQGRGAGFHFAIASGRLGDAAGGHCPSNRTGPA